MSKNKSARSRVKTGAGQAGERPRLLFVDDEENIRLTLPFLHLPSIFQAVIARLMHEGRPLTPRDLQFAARHGRRRKKDGYTPAMLMREFQLIGETIYDLLGSDILPLGAVELTSDLKLLTQSLNVFTLASFAAYSGAR